MLNTVLFDMGGTVEDIWYNDDTARTVTHKILDILEQNGLKPPCDTEAFWQKLSRGVKDYKRWSQGVMLEKKPEEIWCDYYLRDFSFSREIIAPLSETLAQTWESVYYHRELRHGVESTLATLRERGYKLGIISNTASLYAVFNVLEQYGIRDYFTDVTLSSITGYRKPHPSIFEISMRQMHTKPENCVYVGDTISRDIIGSKKAKFAKAVQIRSFMTDLSDMDTCKAELLPDHVIYEIPDLLNCLDS